MCTCPTTVILRSVSLPYSPKFLRHIKILRSTLALFENKCIDGPGDRDEGAHALDSQLRMIPSRPHSSATSNLLYGESTMNEPALYKLGLMGILITNTNNS